MQAPANQDEFSDLKSHQQMWSSFTGALVKGIVTTIIVLLVVGWLTGVL